MLKIDSTTQTLSPLAPSALSDANYQERRDLQQWIVGSSDIFFAEFSDEQFFVIGQEICPSEKVADRIDILALDQSGHAVILELKRGSNKRQMLQAISYAAMISDWTLEDFKACLPIDRQGELDRFLERDLDRTEVNQGQRIILIAEHFEFEVMAAAEWLTAHHSVNVACCQIALRRDRDSDFLTCVQVFPAKELAAQTIDRGRKRVETEAAHDKMEQKLERCINTEIKEYFVRRIREGHRMNASRTALFYPAAGRSRFSTKPRIQFAFALQKGRFPDDISFWNQRLTDKEINVRKEGLGFYLTNEQDIQAFEDVARQAQLPWLRGNDSAESEDE